MLNGEITQVETEISTAMKVSAFERGSKFLALITDEPLRSLASAFWEEAPDYFFVIPASSTGMYHWAAHLGGLFDHVLMGMQCAYELAATFELSAFERDIAIVAIAGHDCLKYGLDYDKRYFDMHPFLPRSHYAYTKHIVSVDVWEIVMCAIERHMGSLKSGLWTSAGGLIPETDIEKVVHLADFMSSRKKITMEVA